MMLCVGSYDGCVGSCDGCVGSCDIGVVMFRNDINLGPSWYTVVDKILSTRYGSHSNYQGGKIYQCEIERLQIEFCK